MADDYSNYRKKLYNIALSLVVILVLFGAILALNAVATEMGFPLFNFTFSNGSAQNILLEPGGRGLPAGIPALPEMSLDDDREIVSLFKAIDITLTHRGMADWTATNSDWMLIHASSDAVNSNGLSYGWNLVLKGNDSIVTATVRNGTLIGMNREDTVAMPIARTPLNKTWDSTWVMYRLTNNTTASSKGNYYVIEYLDEGRAGVYTVSGSDLGLYGNSTSVQVDAFTGNLIGGDGEA